jgi:hypothetical protein
MDDTEFMEIVSIANNFKRLLNPDFSCKNFYNMKYDPANFHFKQQKINKTSSIDISNIKISKTKFYSSLFELREKLITQEKTEVKETNTALINGI